MQADGAFTVVDAVEWEEASKNTSCPTTHVYHALWCFTCFCVLSPTPHSYPSTHVGTTHACTHVSVQPTSLCVHACLLAVMCCAVPWFYLAGASFGTTPTPRLGKPNCESEKSTQEVGRPHARWRWQACVRRMGFPRFTALWSQLHGACVA